MQWLCNNVEAANRRQFVITSNGPSVSLQTSPTNTDTILETNLEVAFTPAFSMNKRDINRSVEMAYNEWFYGDESTPAIASVKDPLRSLWAQESEGNRRWYLRRKLLIDELGWLLKNEVALSYIFEHTQQLVDQHHNGYLHGLQLEVSAAKANGQHRLENILNGYRTRTQHD
ncbi:hypothetical protein TRVA0_047S00804 [Trichomonascus vanleenenianus]|uniref:uncharacterized protein n=1 Tax=Trichomonascus vanleenenianus TaxID=2268995 RepID=UPI003ECBA60C